MAGMWGAEGIAGNSGISVGVSSSSSPHPLSTDPARNNARAESMNLFMLSV